MPNPLPRHLCRRREKLFGMGRPRPMDRNAKIRIMHLARALMHAREPRKAYGAVTAKALAVLEALLWGFHNARSGVCFPGYETIAAKGIVKVNSILPPGAPSPGRAVLFLLMNRRGALQDAMQKMAYTCLP